MKLLKFIVVTISLLGFSTAHSKGQGGWSIGANIGFINADQDDMNSEIETGGVGASKFGNAWEGNAHIGYRMSGSIGLSFRPSYFMYSEEKGTATAFNLSGFTLFPMLKWYMLEDQTIKFFSQFGIGYGRMSGKIEEPTNASVEFSGGNLGYQAGLGAEFCFGGGHCLNVEGNLRFLSIERFTVDSASGTFSSTNITQATSGKEFEVNNHDFAASMSGVLAMVGYTLYF